MDKKQTAVEWLINELISGEYIVCDTFTESVVRLYIKQSLGIEREQLETAFKAGWMRANATNYDPSYFEHFLSETYDNH